MFEIEGGLRAPRKLNASNFTQPQPTNRHFDPSIDDGVLVLYAPPADRDKLVHSLSLLANSWITACRNW